MVLLTLISVCPTWYRIFSMCCDALLASAAKLGWGHLHAAYNECMQVYAVFLAHKK